MVKNYLRNISITYSNVKRKDAKMTKEETEEVVKLLKKLRGGKMWS